MFMYLQSIFFILNIVERNKSRSIHQSYYFDINKSKASIFPKVKCTFHHIQFSKYTLYCKYTNSLRIKREDFRKYVSLSQNNPI